MIVIEVQICLQQQQPNNNFNTFKGTVLVLVHSDVQGLLRGTPGIFGLFLPNEVRTKKRFAALTCLIR